MSVLLHISDVSTHFGGIRALDGISFEVANGEICGLIGPNGSGKTTLFNCLSRLCDVTDGKIVFNGTDLLRVPAHGVASLGLGRTFQNVALFKTLSVIDNIKLGANSTTRSGVFRHALQLPPVGHEEKTLEIRAQELIQEIGLDGAGNRPVSQLNFAAQKKVELARALASRPKLLLLDEPAGGLNHEEVTALGNLIARLRTRLELTVLVIEHHLNFLMSISHTVVALNFGRKIAEGTPDEVRRSPDVIQAYLGNAQ